MGAALFLAGLAVAPPARAADTPTTVPVVLAVELSADHRERVLAAIREWNDALNGSVRFEIEANGARAGVWTVIPVPKSELRNGPESLALTFAFPAGGGVVCLYLDRLGGRDITGVMLHEFGHVLGLTHDGGGQLMSTRYSWHDMKCIDHGTMLQVAAHYKLRIDELKWCGPPAAH